MLCHTIDSILPLLEMLQQPAFCIRKDGTVCSNRAAHHLAPLHGDSLLTWLDSSAPLFAEWDKTGTLELPVRAADRDYSITFRTLEDGLLCILHDLSRTDETQSAMTVAAQILRQPLTDLVSQTGSLAALTEDPALLDKAAAMHRQLYRLSRITTNLSDLQLLQTGQYPQRMERLDGAELLTQLLEEVSELAEESGHPTTWSVPAKNAGLQGDPRLLKRAVLNLISNAWKYAPEDTPIVVQAHIYPERLTIQVSNHCNEDEAAILRGAFDRLHQRDLLPDPRWGMGLGLPLAQAIARLHGGLVALEYRNGTVTVTMTISRQRSTDTKVLALPPVYYDGGLGQTRIELSDCLPNRAYHPDAL